MNKISEFKLNIKISKIQRLFRINKVNKMLREFRELEISKHAGKINFKKFCKLLRTKKVVLKTCEISKYYSKIGYKNKLNGQKILSSYIFKYFADNILEIEKNRYTNDKEIISWGENLVDLLDNIEINDYNTFITFGKFLVNYERLMNEWLKSDKNRTIESIIISYKYNRDTIEKIKETDKIKMSPDQKKDIIDEITKQNNELLNSLIILDKSFNIKYLEKNYQEIYNNLEKGYDKLLTDLTLNAKKAFVDKVKLDLQQGEIKSLVFNFIEIGKRLIEICPKRYKKSFEKKFTKEYITDIFYDRCWNNSNKQFLLLILDTIIMFDSKENEKENFKFKNIVSVLTLNNFIENAPKIILIVNEKIDDLIRLIIKLAKK